MTKMTIVITIFCLSVARDKFSFQSRRITFGRQIISIASYSIIIFYPSVDLLSYNTGQTVKNGIVLSPFPILHGAFFK